MVYLYSPATDSIDIDGYQPQRQVLLSFNRQHIAKIVMRLFALPSSLIVHSSAFFYIEVNSDQSAMLRLHGVKTIATGRFRAMQDFKLGAQAEQQKQLF